MKFSWHPDAEEELDRVAYYYYLVVGSQMVESLAASINGIIQVLSDHPSAGLISFGRYRKFPLKSFPCSLIYVVGADGKSIHQLALAHHSRYPDYWRYRVREPACTYSDCSKNSNVLATMASGASSIKKNPVSG